MSLAIVPLYLYALAAFLGPGLAVVLRVGSTRELRPTYAIAVVFACGGVLGYIAFWLYFANKSAGRTFSYIVAGTSFLLLAKLLLTDARSRNLARQLSPPFAYLAVVGACYLSILFAVADPFPVGQDLMDWRFFASVRPGDNIIPWLFASKIYLRQPLIPFCCGDWLSSDRPPLQAGIFLLFWPLKAFARAGLYYQLLSTGLQCSWVCAVWVFLRTLGASHRRIVQTLGLLIPSVFLFYNSVYTWPKLLAASFILFAASVCLTAIIEARALNVAEILLSSSCVGLATMAHPGSLFSLPLFGLFVASKRRLSWRGLLLAALIIACFAIPWKLYQKYVDPPGNRLMKLHLAGVIPADSRSTWQAVRDSYGKLTIKQVLTFKWENVVYMLGPESMSGVGLQGFHFDRGIRVNPGALETARVAQRDYIWNAIGFLNTGWLAAIFVLLSRRPAAIPYARWVLLAGVANLLLWCLIIFGPAGTPVAHSSYADILLVMLGLSGFLLALPRWVPLSVMGLQILNVLFVWLPFRPVSPIFRTVTQWPLVVFAALLGLSLMWYTLTAFSASNRSTVSLTRFPA